MELGWIDKKFYFLNLSFYLLSIDTKDLPFFNNVINTYDVHLLVIAWNVQNLNSLITNKGNPVNCHFTYIIILKTLYKFQKQFFVLLFRLVKDVILQTNKITFLIINDGNPPGLLY